VNGLPDRRLFVVQAADQPVGDSGEHPPVPEERNEFPEDPGVILGHPAVFLPARLDQRAEPVEGIAIGLAQAPLPCLGLGIPVVQSVECARHDFLVAPVEAAPLPVHPVADLVQFVLERSAVFRHHLPGIPARAIQPLVSGQVTHALQRLVQVTAAEVVAATGNPLPIEEISAALRTGQQARIFAGGEFFQ